MSVGVQVQVLTRGRVLHVVAWSALFALLAIAVSVQVGSYDVDWSNALRGVNGPDRDVAVHRLLRSLLAFAVGASLASVGCVFQALTRNPLADPFLLGVSGGAALGATGLIAAGVSTFTVAQWTIPATPFGAFVGALFALQVVHQLSIVRGRIQVHRILLVGVVFNFFASALIMGIKALIPVESIRSVMLWLMGSLSGLKPVEEALGELIIVGGLVILGTGWMVLNARALNVASLGDDGARHLGFDLNRVRKRAFIMASLVVGAAVSVAGLIGFVGLIVPHALRQILGADHRLLVPACVLTGGGFLVLCDGAARVLFPILLTDPPVGVLTALVGGPLFVWLLVRGRVATGWERGA
jgi:iron complex transport system permease protein